MGGMGVAVERSAGDLGEVLLCPCEDVTLAAVERAIHTLGARSLDEVRKLTRAGMGACQGRTCASLVRERLVAAGVDAPDTGTFRARPPLRLVPVRALAAWGATLTEPAGAVDADVLWGRSAGGGTVRLDEGEDDDAAGTGHGPAGIGVGGA